VVGRCRGGRESLVRESERREDGVPISRGREVSSKFPARAPALRLEPDLWSCGGRDGAVASQSKRRGSHLDALELEAEPVRRRDDDRPHGTGRSGECARFRPMRLGPAIDDEVKATAGTLRGIVGDYPGERAGDARRVMPGPRAQTEGPPERRERLIRDFDDPLRGTTVGRQVLRRRLRPRASGRSEPHIERVTPCLEGKRRVGPACSAEK